jgi:hypothetical protein
VMPSTEPQLTVEGGNPVDPAPIYWYNWGR